MTGSRAPTPDAHAAHDLVRIAALADRDPDLRPREAETARALLVACTDCARLYADLQALALALPATATPARPRDFTLSAADAERLRPHGLRHWLGLIGSARDTITRPLAIGFTTLGLAGLLVATVPGALPSASSAGGARVSAVGDALEGAAGAGASAEALQMSGAPAAPEATKVDDGGVFSGSDSGDPAATAQREQPAVAAPGPDATPLAVSSGDTTLVTLAVLLTVAGLGLFALRWSARRFVRR